MQVSANFIANIIRDTAPFSLGKYAIHTDGVVYQPKSYTLAIKGVQLFNVSRNLFENSLMEFELVAGVKASSLSNVLNARENFWGKTSIEEIRSRIFDFDDWNSYAIADFVPFLGERTICLKHPLYMIARMQKRGIKWSISIVQCRCTNISPQLAVG